MDGANRRFMVEMVRSKLVQTPLTWELLRADNSNRPNRKQ